MGWRYGDVGDAGGHDGGILSLWGEGGQVWAETDAGSNAPLDCCLPLLSPQGC